MYPFIPAILGAMRGLKRRCPKCGREQLVPRDKTRKSVSYKLCKADIPSPLRNSSRLKRSQAEVCIRGPFGPFSL